MDLDQQKKIYKNEAKSTVYGYKVEKINKKSTVEIARKRLIQFK